MTEPIWTPGPAELTGSGIARFSRWLAERGPVVSADDYLGLWRWSVDHLEEFWAAVWDHFEIRSATAYTRVLSGSVMPDVRWFEGARLSYVEHVFAGRDPERSALIDVRETAGGTASRTLTWRQLRAEVAGAAALLRELGVRPGDRVVGYLPNTAESVIAFLATASLGGVWSACGQDYAPEAAANRLGQLDPVVLFAADGYRYGGREVDRRAAVRTLAGSLPSVRATVVFSRLGLDFEPGAGRYPWPSADEQAGLETEDVPFSHPLWVLFSSGTTGRPKGIVHSTGGVLLEHLKSLAFGLDLSWDDTFFWHTSPSWMVWNYLASALLVGSRIVCYDGSPGYPSPDRLWELAAEHGVTVLGTSPAHLTASAQAGLEPARDHDLSALRSIGSSGSVLPAGSYHWVAQHVGERVRVNSTSGGTDIVSAFAGSVPTVPVWPGELSVPSLGVALDAWDEDGRPVRGTTGELVVTKPMPSMPIAFWGDPDGTRYRDSYFDVYPGIWRHGDWITITERESVIVHGRSDSTLNRNGVRFGSADIYEVLARLPEITDSLVLGVERPEGEYWMPLFVVLAPGHTLDDALRDRIRRAIREQASPRHVPDDIFAAPRLPHTRTGKKLEVPIKRILQGAEAARVVDFGAVDDADAVRWFGAYRGGTGPAA
ncbi:MAG TPA: acetoacetate--CoA ligase [Amycolatopsis sp.]